MARPKQTVDAAAPSGTVVSRYEYLPHYSNFGTTWLTPELCAFQQLDTWHKRGLNPVLSSDGTHWDIQLSKAAPNGATFNLHLYLNPTPLAAIQSAMEVVK